MSKYKMAFITSVALSAIFFMPQIIIAYGVMLGCAYTKNQEGVALCMFIIGLLPALAARQLWYAL